MRRQSYLGVLIALLLITAFNNCSSGGFEAISTPSPISNGGLGSAGPTPTPTPLSTATPTPQASATPNASVTPTPMPTATPVRTPTPTPTPNPTATPPPSPTPKPTPPPTPTPAAGMIKHIFIVMFENTNAQDSKSQPFMKSLIPKGAYLNNFHGIAHPSQPNYVALIAGDTLGVVDDNNVNLNGSHLGDLLEAKGRSWKIYVEDYPGNCYTGAQSKTYVRKHNPFISFNNMQSNSTRCNAHIVPATQLDKDIANNQIPEYAMYVPGLNSDGHDTGVAYADNWLQNTFSSKLSNPSFIDGMAFVVTFDENDADNDIGNNLIYTLIYGPSAGIKAGYVSNTLYDHYSLLRFVEDTFSLGNLNRKDKSAASITGISN